MYKYFRHIPLCYSSFNTFYCVYKWALGQFVTSLLFQIVKRLSRVHSHPPEKRGSSAQLPQWHPWSLLLPPGSWSKDKCCFQRLCYRGNSAQWMKTQNLSDNECWKQWVNTACQSLYLFSWARGSLSSNCWMLPKSYQITLIRRVSLSTVFLHSGIKYESCDFDRLNIFCFNKVICLFWLPNCIPKI